MSDFVKKIKDKLSKPEFEKERISRLNKMILTEIITLVILFLGVKLFIFWQANNHPVLAGILGFIYLFVVVFFFGNPFWENKEFKQYLKDNCVGDIKKLLEISSFKGSKFSEEELKESDLFSSFNETNYDDVIEGTYNGVSYKVAETQLIAHGRKTDYTVFKGLVLSFSSNKDFSAKTLITTKGDSYIRNYTPGVKYMVKIIITTSIILPLIMFIPFAGKILPVIMSDKSIFVNIFPTLFSGFIFGNLPIFIVLAILIFAWWKKKKKLQDVKLEDVSFEKKFDIHTNDQIEARYLVTTAFMERLQNLQTAFGTKNIKCSFFDDKIMFAISTNIDLFELGSLYKPIGKDIEIFYNQMQSIYDIIDYFKLNEKTGL